MSDSQVELVTLGSEEEVSNFKILKQEAVKIWARVHCRCRECPTPPIPHWDELCKLKIPKSRSGVLKEARAWAEYLSQFVRCPVCPGSRIPHKLYETGSCEHKFCKYCMNHRNLGRLECCICDMKIDPGRVKVDDFYSEVAVRLRNFIEDVDKELARSESESAFEEEVGTSEAETEVSDGSVAGD